MFLRMDQWDARNGEGPYRKEPATSTPDWLPTHKPIRIPWVLIGAFLTAIFLLGYL